MARFVLVREPNDLWAVFDVVTGVPASIGGKPQIGLTEAAAKAVADHANAAPPNPPTAAGPESPKL